MPLSFFSVDKGINADWIVVRKTFTGFTGEQSENQGLHTEILEHHLTMRAAEQAALLFAAQGRLPYIGQDVTVLTVLPSTTGFASFELSPKGSILFLGNFSNFKQAKIDTQVRSTQYRCIVIYPKEEGLV